MSEVIVDIQPGHERYERAFSVINGFRRQAELPPIPEGETVTVVAGELLPWQERQCIEYEQNYAKKLAGEQKKPVKKKPATGLQKGRFGLINNHVDVTSHRLSPTENWVWTVIWRLANGQTNLIKLSVRDLADRAGVSKNTADKTVRQLVKLGALVCVFKSRTKGTPSTYRLADAAKSNLPPR